MSYMAFHADALLAILGKFWGIKLKDDNGNLRDSGVQEFAETLGQLLSAIGPITLERPLEFINKTNGPAIKIYNTGDKDWMGVRVQDEAGNEAQFGIGLGNEGITANSFIPHPKYSIDPNDAHRFYSETGGNAGTDRDHPRAVEAGNGLIGFPYLIDNYTVPQWNWFNPPVFVDDDCHPHYTWNLNGASVILPTYVPQSELIKVTAQEEITQGNSGTFQDANGTDYTADNPYYLCIANGDSAVLACIDGEYVALVTEQHSLFMTGETYEDIAQGGSGTVTVSGSGISAQSPFGGISSGTEVAIARESICSGWIIISAEC